MSLYAIGDLHFGQSLEKPMDIFGENWKNHEQKIVDHWNKVVKEEDTVLIAGDISWGMRIEEARPHLDTIACLPGRKICIEGNHDFWWSSTARVRKAFPDLIFLKNDCVFYEDIAICGSRGWICPRDTFFTPADEKIYLREQIRLKLSISEALRQGAKRIILFMHYPPTNDKKQASGFTEIINKYPQIEKVIYAHIHGDGAKRSSLTGRHNNAEYFFVSADYLDFCPKKIV